jgi:predicted methyltransferase
MSGRKIDYFGTFLDSMKSKPAGGDTDPLNAVLKALQDGDRSAKDLLPLTGNSLSLFVEVSRKLIELGWAVRLDGDVLRLTDSGRNVAEVLT